MWKICLLLAALFIGGRSIAQEPASTDSLVPCLQCDGKGVKEQACWLWGATQLNTSMVASDFGEEPITVQLIEEHLENSFNLAKENHRGWPRGLQSGVAVVGTLISKVKTAEAVEYCEMSKSGKKWAAFTVPVVVDATTVEWTRFSKNPIWGRLYYPHISRLIDGLEGK